jgi:hypothetical protein
LREGGTNLEIYVYFLYSGYHILKYHMIFMFINFIIFNFNLTFWHWNLAFKF